MLRVMLRAHDKMSFYLTLTSSDERGIFPQNQPGNFQVLLDNVLDLRESWEVGLVEMGFTNQAFPNLPSDVGNITLRVKDEYIYQDDYCITYDETFGLNIKYEYYSVPPGRNPLKDRVLTNSKFIEIPQQHYSWFTFKETLREITIHNRARCIVDDTRITFVGPKPAATQFVVTLSPKLTSLLNAITEEPRMEEDYIPYKTYKMVRPYKIRRPPNKPDSTQMIFTPDCVEKNVSIIVGSQVILTLSNQFWTIEQLKRAIKVASEEANNNHVSSIVLSDYSLTITPKKQASHEEFPVDVRFSTQFAYVFGLDKTNSHLLNHNVDLVIPVKLRRCEEISSGITFIESQSLTHNFYPTITSLVDEINQIINVCSRKISIKQKITFHSHNFFSVDNNVVTYNAKVGYELKFDPFLLKLMQLPIIGWTTKTSSGTSAAEMKPFFQALFYVHCDCLEPHYINNIATELLKIVSNRATLGEKVILPFHDVQYHKVAKRFVSCINMYITDSLFGRVMQLDSHVIYTLHFRKCPFT